MAYKTIVEIENISVDELVATTTDKVLDGLENRLEQLQQKKHQEQLLTRTETIQYLKVDSSTLWSWTKNRKLTAYKLGNRVYYKKNEIDESLVRIK
jgi:predicted DNA-binding transcriptional regulator AlpA